MVEIHPALRSEHFSAASLGRTEFSKWKSRILVSDQINRFNDQPLNEWSLQTQLVLEIGLQLQGRHGIHQGSGWRRPGFDRFERIHQRSSARDHRSNPDQMLLDVAAQQAKLAQQTLQTKQIAKLTGVLTTSWESWMKGRYYSGRAAFEGSRIGLAGKAISPR